MQRKRELTSKSFSTLTPEEKAELRELWAEDELWEEKDPEDKEGEEQTEESQGEVDVEAEIRAKKLSILDEMQRQLDAQKSFDTFWNSILVSPAWCETLRNYIGLVTTITQGTANKVVITVERDPLNPDHVLFGAHFFDKNGKPIIHQADGTTIESSKGTKQID